MSCCRIQLVVIVSFMLLLPNSQGWGDEGHTIVCKIAQVPNITYYLSVSSYLSDWFVNLHSLIFLTLEQARLTDSAAEAVKKLLPKSAEDLASKCSWADHLKVVFPWASALHYADTPDSVCSYEHDSKFLSHCFRGP